MEWPNVLRLVGEMLPNSMEHRCLIEQLQEAFPTHPWSELRVRSLPVWALFVYGAQLYYEMYMFLPHPTELSLSNKPIYFCSPTYVCCTCRCPLAPPESPEYFYADPPTADDLADATRNHLLEHGGAAISGVGYRLVSTHNGATTRTCHYAYGDSKEYPATELRWIRTREEPGRYGAPDTPATSACAASETYSTFGMLASWDQLRSTAGATHAAVMISGRLCVVFIPNQHDRGAAEHGHKTGRPAGVVRVHLAPPSLRRSLTPTGESAMASARLYRDRHGVCHLSSRALSANTPSQFAEHRPTLPLLRATAAAAGALASDGLECVLHVLESLQLVSIDADDAASLQASVRPHHTLRAALPRCLSTTTCVSAARSGIVGLVCPSETPTKTGGPDRVVLVNPELHRLCARFRQRRFVDPLHTIVLSRDLFRRQKGRVRIRLQAAPHLNEGTRKATAPGATHTFTLADGVRDGAVRVCDIDPEEDIDHVSSHTGLSSRESLVRVTLQWQYCSSWEWSFPKADMCQQVLKLNLARMCTASGPDKAGTTPTKTPAAPTTQLHMAPSDNHTFVVFVNDDRYFRCMECAQPNRFKDRRFCDSERNKYGIVVHIQEQGGRLLDKLWLYACSRVTMSKLNQSTYATWWERNELQRASGRKGLLVLNPLQYQLALSNYTRTKTTHTKNFNCTVSKSTDSDWFHLSSLNLHTLFEEASAAATRNSRSDAPHSRNRGATGADIQAVPQFVMSGVLHHTHQNALVIGDGSDDVRDSAPEAATLDRLWARVVGVPHISRSWLLSAITPHMLLGVKDGRLVNRRGTYHTRLLATSPFEPFLTTDHELKTAFSEDALQSMPHEWQVLLNTHRGQNGTFGADRHLATRLIRCWHYLCDTLRVDTAISGDFQCWWEILTRVGLPRQDVMCQVPTPARPASMSFPQRHALCYFFVELKDGSDSATATHLVCPHSSVRPLLWDPYEPVDTDQNGNRPMPSHDVLHFAVCVRVQCPQRLAVNHFLLRDVSGSGHGRPRGSEHKRSKTSPFVFRCFRSRIRQFCQLRPHSLRAALHHYYPQVHTAESPFHCAYAYFYFKLFHQLQRCVVDQWTPIPRTPAYVRLPESLPASTTAEHTALCHALRTHHIDTADSWQMIHPIKLAVTHVRGLLDASTAGQSGSRKTRRGKVVYMVPVSVDHSRGAQYSTQLRRMPSPSHRLPQVFETVLLMMSVAKHLRRTQRPDGSGSLSDTTAALLGSGYHPCGYQLRAATGMIIGVCLRNGGVVPCADAPYGEVLRDKRLPRLAVHPLAASHEWQVPESDTSSVAAPLTSLWNAFAAALERVSAEYARSTARWNAPERSEQLQGLFDRAVDRTLSSSTAEPAIQKTLLQKLFRHHLLSSGHASSALYKAVCNGDVQSFRRYFVGARTRLQESSSSAVDHTSESEHELPALNTSLSHSSVNQQPTDILFRKLFQKSSQRHEHCAEPSLLSDNSKHQIDRLLPSPYRQLLPNVRVMRNESAVLSHILPPREGGPRLGTSTLPLRCIAEAEIAQYIRQPIFILNENRFLQPSPATLPGSKLASALPHIPLENSVVMLSRPVHNRVVVYVHVSQSGSLAITNPLHRKTNRSEKGARPASSTTPWLPFPYFECFEAMQKGRPRVMAVRLTPLFPEQASRTEMRATLNADGHLAVTHPTQRAALIQAARKAASVRPTNGSMLPVVLQLDTAVCRIVQCQLLKQRVFRSQSHSPFNCVERGGPAKTPSTNDRQGSHLKNLLFRQLPPTTAQDPRKQTSGQPATFWCM